MRLGALALLLGVLLVPMVEARLGGGGSYRSRSYSSSSSRSYSSSSYSSRSYGGSSYGGSSYSGTPDIEVSDRGLVLMLLLVLLIGQVARLVLGTTARLVGTARVGAAGDPSQQAPGASLAQLRQLDRGFSRAVLRDMVGALWVKLHEARGHGNAAPLQRLLGAKVWRQLNFAMPAERRGHPDAVEDVVLGGMTIRAVEPRGQVQRVAVEVRGNLTETRQGTTRVFYVEEQWVLERPSGSLSPKPAVARSLGCPSCGAPAEATVTGTCTFCDQPVPEHPLGWTVETISRLHQEALPPLQPDTGGVEAGTRLPTRLDPELGAQRRACSGRHPDFDWSAYSTFVEETFHTLQRAWTDQDLDTLRSLETPGLFRTHRFWLERYQKKGWTNRLEDIELKDPELARIEVDAHYEAVVLRFFAEGLEYTLDESGELVAGSKDRKRSFSEYWTFLRAAGATQKTLDPKSCPACGAPRDKLSAAGVCGYCDAAIMDGEHGWVLGLIEQDEEYLG